MHSLKSLSNCSFSNKFSTTKHHLVFSIVHLKKKKKKKNEEEIGDLKNSRQSRQMPPKLKMRTKQIDQRYQSKKHSNFHSVCSVQFAPL